MVAWLLLLGNVPSLFFPQAVSTNHTSTSMHHAKQLLNLQSIQASNSVPNSSNNKHFFASGAAGGMLHYRNAWCPCQKCVQDAQLCSCDCQLTEIVGEVGSTHLKRLVQAQPVETLTNQGKQYNVYG